MQLFYTSDISADSETYTFDKEESRHIIKVLRKKEADDVFVTDGSGLFFKTKIILASDSKCTVKIISVDVRQPMKYKLHLGVSPTKMNDRFEWLLEKATEIGVTEITPLICERSERTTLKPERMEKIILSAMKQSLNCFLPILHPPTTFKSFITMQNHGLRLIGHCLESDKKSLKDVITAGADSTILIGPEGDFSESEVNLAIVESYIPISLGATRLRTETAAIVACHSVAFINA